MRFYSAPDVIKLPRYMKVLNCLILIPSTSTLYFGVTVLFESVMLKVSLLLISRINFILSSGITDSLLYGIDVPPTNFFFEKIIP